eukprot:comp18142_c0_seq1/m.31891 comp18142_c0_seq1/g.31891  ORF comp18142_c0_seq1/g.31891 comp18142_c0_seq1/m.31891 type:complete len:341 (-) comp18142_c0_seq1:318-1340(-)
MVVFTFFSADCAPAISATNVLSFCRSLNSSCESLNWVSRSSMISLSRCLSLLSCILRSSSSWRAWASRSSVCWNSDSSRCLVTSNSCWSCSMRLLYSSMEFFISVSSVRRLSSSAALPIIVPRITSTSSLSSTISCSRLWRSVWLRATKRSAAAIFASSCLFCSISCSRNLLRSAIAISRAAISRFPAAYFSAAFWIASSRCFIASRAFWNWTIRPWRSLCRFLKSSAFLSSSIWHACVSVISSARSCFFCAMALVSRWICRSSSRILASSWRLYFSSARLSSSFCRAATAHCSSSSLFQLVCCLICSICSCARNTLLCVTFSFSCTSSISLSSFPTSLR